MVGWLKMTGVVIKHSTKTKIKHINLDKYCKIEKEKKRGEKLARIQNKGFHRFDENIIKLPGKVK